MSSQMFFSRWEWRANRECAGWTGSGTASVDTDRGVGAIYGIIALAGIGCKARVTKTICFFVPREKTSLAGLRNYVRGRGPMLFEQSKADGHESRDVLPFHPFH